MFAAQALLICFIAGIALGRPKACATKPNKRFGWKIVVICTLCCRSQVPRAMWRATTGHCACCRQTLTLFLNLHRLLQESGVGGRVRPEPVELPM